MLILALGSRMMAAATAAAMVFAAVAMALAALVPLDVAISSGP